MPAIFVIGDPDVQDIIDVPCAREETETKFQLNGREEILKK